MVNEHEEIEASSQYYKQKEKEWEHFKAAFTLAGIQILFSWELVNPYWPRHPRYFPRATPWYLVSTQYGLVTIGWRKRVIAVNWEHTKVRTTVTNDDVTKSNVGVHAWDYMKLLEYLIAFEAAAKLDKGLRENVDAT